MRAKGKELLDRLKAPLMGMLTGGATAIGFSASVWAAACAPKKMTQAEISKEIRKIQTTLMVAALSCGQRDNYNNFVLKFRPVLQRYGQVMKADFRKRYGAGAKKRLNAYVTTLANEASQRSNVDFDAFCSDAGRLYNNLKARKPKELGPFVSKPKYIAFGGTYKPRDCVKPKQLFPDVRKKDPLGPKARPKG